MTIKQIGIDIGKMKFHMVALSAGNEIVMRKQFNRSQLLAFFQKQSDLRMQIALEACSGSHWLAHQLVAMGHEVTLLTPESVKPFAKPQKNGWICRRCIACGKG
ncbi:transposase [Cohaesibacter sp. ES.047]|uniref:IS110 family transposase n=1 Tax=Cohaesibacter sp. ES.047 TaxID=1798205 RepID=UPI000BB78DDE|nr:transposase [Cohaesibacter sp. ES.047]